MDDREKLTESMAWKVPILVYPLPGFILLLTVQAVRDTRNLAYQYIEDTSICEVNEDKRL